MSLKEQMDAKHAGLPPPCVETDPQTETITVYPSGEESWVFPWLRFGWARLRDGELAMSFSDQKIIIKGKNLERVLQHMRGVHVETVRTVAEHFWPLFKDSDPMVTSIAVRPAE